jgi:Protein of unknown function (DUF5818)
MKKLGSVLVLLSTTYVLGQIGSNSMNGNRFSGQSGSLAVHATVVGCLVGGSGGYMLIDNSGRLYNLEGNTNLVSPYLGAQVEATGTVSGVSSLDVAGESASRSASIGRMSIGESSAVVGTNNVGGGLNEAGNEHLSLTGAVKVADTCDETAE